MNKTKTRLLCAILSCLLILTLLPLSLLSVGAESTAPATLPDGETKYTTGPFIDYAAVGASGGGADYVAGTGYSVTVANATFIYSNASQNTTAWQSAKGIMLSYDATNSTGNVPFYTVLLMSEAPIRHTDGKAGSAQFRSTPSAQSGFSSDYYIYTDGAWAKSTVTQYNCFLTKGTKGFVYIPLESYLYYGPSGVGVSAETKCVGFAEGMEMLTNKQIWKFGINTGGDAVGCVFEKAEFVYEEIIVDGTMPTVLPDDRNVDGVKLWVDWDAAGIENDNAALENGYNKVTAKDKQAWTKNGVNTTAWKGASGLMFRVDASGVDANVDFLLEILSVAARPNSASGNGNVQFKTQPTVWRDEQSGGPLKVGETGYAYYYQNNQWVDFGVSYPSYYLNAGSNYSGWYYVPFESFWYLGGSGNGFDLFDSENPTGIMSFPDFMSRFQDQTLWKLSMKSNTPGMKFGDVYFVYSNPDAIDAECAASQMFGSMALNGNPEGSAKGTVNGSAVTVSGMTGNSAAASGNRVWLKGLMQTNLSGASGMRFYVDTTAMSAEAAVQLRIRMRASAAIGNVKNVFAAGAGGFATLTGGMPQYVCRGENSVAYYYDASGAAQALHVSSSVSAAADGDLFEALPAGYKGYVYLPFDSFWMSCGSYGNLTCAIPFSVAMEQYPVDLITLCGSVSGVDAGSDSVTYSDFELVYADTAMTGASVTLTNNFNVNFYAHIQQSAADAKIIFTVGSKTVTAAGELQADGSYRFVCENLLPQTVTDTIYANLSATVNGAAVSQTREYSVREYCENMLAKEDSSAAFKQLLVDLLYYGEAAQQYANYKTDDLATKNLTEAQKALRSADKTASITAAPGRTGTPNEQYKWVSAALRLENTMAIRFRLEAASLDGLTAEVTVNGRTVTFTEFVEDNGSYVLLFNNIGADEYDSTVTAMLKQNGEQIGEALTYSVAAYLKEAVQNTEASDVLRNLLRSIYSYGLSAKAYAAAQGGQ